MQELDLYEGEPAGPMQVTEQGENKFQVQLHMA